MSVSDSEILLKFKDENTKSYAINLLVQKYQSRLYWHIRRMVIDHDDANDVVQNTFIKVYKNLQNFKEESKLYTWLYKIATNESMTFLKQKRSKFIIPINDVEYQLSNTLKDDSLFTGDEIQLKLQKAILTLPEKQRLVFNMKYYDELQYDEMSEILGTSVGALKASFHHAVTKIEKYLTNL